MDCLSFEFVNFGKQRCIKNVLAWLINTGKDAQYYFLLRELQIKTTMKYHLTPVRMAIIKKSANNKGWRGCEEKGTLLQFWWDCKLIQPLRQYGESLKNYDPAIPLLDIYLEESTIEKDTCIPLFIAALFTIVKTWKQP